MHVLLFPCAFSLVAIAGLEKEAWFPTVPGCSFDEAFAESVASAGDLNGDGKNDWLIAGSNPGEVWVVSGGRPRPLRHILPRSPTGTGFTNVSSLGDVNGDGVLDMLVSAGRGSRLAVRAYDGKGGQMLYEVPADCALPIGDVDGDHRIDFITSEFTSSSDDPHKPLMRFQVCSGVDGHVMRTIEIPGVPSRNTNVSIAALGDVDGDGVPDWAGIVAREAIVFSGKTGSTLHTFGGRGTTYPCALCGVSDGGKDGHAVVVIGYPGDVDVQHGSSIVVCSITDGRELHEIGEPNGLAGRFLFSSGGESGKRASNFGVVANSDFGGVDSVSIYSVGSSTPVGGCGYVTNVNSKGLAAVAIVPDVDGDEVDDYLVGTPDLEPGNRTPGAACVISGATKGILRELRLADLRSAWADSKH